MASNHNLLAVYDISSSSVAGAHVLAKNKERSVVFLASARNDAPLQEDMDIKRFVEDTIKHLEKIISRVRKADVHHPTFIQIVLASPWYSSQTRTVNYSEEEPFTCTKKLVDSLIEKEIEYILKNEEGSFGVFGTESIIIEKQLSQIKLNGYETNTPYGKKAVTLELFLTITVAPKEIIERFSDTFKRAYGTRAIGYTTSPFATYIVMRDVESIDKECFIIDVGEEVTDVAFIKNSILLYQHSFPVGTYALYRTLADGGTHNVHETTALLESYKQGKLSEGVAESISKGIETYSKQWQDAFRQVVDSGQYGFSLPKTCLITSDPRFEIIFTNIIKTDTFIQSTQMPVVPIFMKESSFKIPVTAMDNTEIDIPLATASIFAEHLIT